MVAALSYARVLVAGVLFLIISACGGGGGGGEDDAEPVSGTDGAPLIGGIPPTTVRVGEPYTFAPSCIDPDGDELQFTAARLPPWAALDPHTGKLTGRPRAGDEGAYVGITIRVSDGVSEATLPAFAIEVSQSANGRATLSWDAPSQHLDGSALTDLAGYRIEYGRQADDLDHFVLIDNPAINSAVIEQLSAGTWHFAVVAYDNKSIESKPSVLASQVIT